MRTTSKASVVFSSCTTTHAYCWRNVAKARCQWCGAPATGAAVAADASDAEMELDEAAPERKEEDNADVNAEEEDDAGGSATAFSYTHTFISTEREAAKRYGNQHILKSVEP